VSVLLQGDSLLERAAAISSAPATSLLDRLSDRDRGPQWQAASTAIVDLVIDAGVGKTLSASHLALINHNLTVVVYVLTSPTGASYTLRASGTPNADPWVLPLGGTFADRFWDVQISATAAAAKLGELLLGLGRTVVDNPFIRSAGLITVGNVGRDITPGGNRRSVLRGPKRERLAWAWNGMPAADLVNYLAAYSDVNQGAKKLIVQDQLGVARWMDWLDESIEPVPVGNGLSEVKGTFETAL
jgi:hypothetical protein